MFEFLPAGYFWSMQHTASELSLSSFALAALRPIPHLYNTAPSQLTHRRSAQHTASFSCLGKDTVKLSHPELSCHLCHLRLVCPCVCVRERASPWAGSVLWEATVITHKLECTGRGTGLDLIIISETERTWLMWLYVWEKVLLVVEQLSVSYTVTLGRCGEVTNNLKNIQSHICVAELIQKHFQTPGRWKRHSRTCCVSHFCRITQVSTDKKTPFLWASGKQTGLLAHRASKCQNNNCGICLCNNCINVEHTSPGGSCGWRLGGN